MGLKSRCESVRLFGVQHALTFANVISASGGGPLCWLMARPLTLSCSTRSHQTLRYSDPWVNHLYLYTWLVKDVSAVLFAGRKIYMGLVVLLPAAFRDELLQPCILQLRAVSSQGATPNSSSIKVLQSIKRRCWVQVGEER